MRDTDQAAALAEFEEQLWTRLAYEPRPPDRDYNWYCNFIYDRPRRIVEQVRMLLEGASENGPIL